MIQSIDKLVDSPVCDSNACYESEFQTEDGPVKTWLCMTSGYTSNTTMTLDSEALKEILEYTADLIKESKWFNINIDIASRAMKDVFKHYKKYWEKSRKQTQYLKDNFSFDKMTEKLGLLLPKVSPAPQMQQLNLPKLKKVSDSKPELPKIKLPKLKKIKS